MKNVKQLISSKLIVIFFNNINKHVDILYCRFINTKFEANTNINNKSIIYSIKY